MRPKRLRLPALTPSRQRRRRRRLRRIISRELQPYAGKRITQDLVRDMAAFLGALESRYGHLFY